MYIVKYSNDWQPIDIFVTNDKAKAKRYVEKFNNMLKKWKKHYEQYTEIRNGTIWIKKEYEDKFFDRWISLNDTNSCYFVEIELR